jgi:hypothetical protein
MPLYIGTPRSMADKDILAWAKAALHEIERADRERADIAMIAQDFTLTNYTALRTLDGTAGTLDEVRNFLCTFIDDIKRRGRAGKD